MESENGFPTVILLLTHVRRIESEEARQLVNAEFGESAATTIQRFGEDPSYMQYIQWRLGQTPYHIGTSSEPYINAGGEASLDPVTGAVLEMKWRMREEVPPDGEAELEAWMSHVAWMYVDALTFHSFSPAEHREHFQHVLKTAGRLVDDRCALLWLWGSTDRPKRVALPTPNTLASLRRGIWPE